MSKNKIEIEKREVREEKINITTARAQERRQHARGIRMLQARKERGGGVAPRRDNRITESATKESREANICQPPNLSLIHISEPTRPY